METTFCSLKKRRSREEGETRERVRRRKPYPRTVTSRSFNILSPNVGGLSELGTKHALAAFATGSKADFIVLTESHLRAEDPRAIVVEKYEVITEHSRLPDLDKMCGGGQPC